MRRRRFFHDTMRFCGYGMMAAMILTASSDGAGAAQEKQKMPDFELSINSAILFALHNNPDIGIANERKNQAHHTAEEGRAALLPQIEMSLQGGEEYNKPASGVEDGKSNLNSSGSASFTLTQLLYDGGQKVEEWNRRQELVTTSQLQTDLKTEQLITESVKYYLAILRYQGEMHDAQVFYGKVSEIVDYVNDMFNAGSASKAMVEYVDSRLASAENTVNEARSALNDAISNLEFLTGKLPPFTASIPEQLNPEKLDLDYYMKLARKENNQMKITQSEKVAAKHKVKSEEGKFFPTIDVRFSANHQNNSGGEIGRDRGLDAFVRLNYKIFDGFARDAAIGRAQSQLREVDIRRKKIMKELKKNLKLSYNQVLASQASLQATYLEIESNKALQKLNWENFKLGSINVIELLEGEERLNRSHARKHEMTSKLFENTYRLLLQAGIMEKNYFCVSC